MTNNVINLTENQGYKAFRVVPNKKAVATLVIHTQDGGSILYPYFFIHPTRIKKISENYYTMNLLGGGLDIILHLKNFDNATYQAFIEGFAKRTINEIHEFAGDTGLVGFPTIAQVEKFQ